MALITAVGLGALTAADWISAGQLASKAVAPTSAKIMKFRDNGRAEKFWARAISDNDVRIMRRSARGAVAKDLARLSQDPSVLLMSAEATRQRMLDARRVLDELPDNGKVHKEPLIQAVDKGSDPSTLGKRLSAILQAPETPRGTDSLPKHERSLLDDALQILGQGPSSSDNRLVASAKEPHEYLSGLLGIKAAIEIRREKRDPDWDAILKDWARRTGHKYENTRQWAEHVARRFVLFANDSPYMAETVASLHASPEEQQAYLKQTLEIRHLQAVVRSANAVRGIAVSVVVVVGVLLGGLTLDAIELVDFSSLLQNILADDAECFLELMSGC